MPSFRILLAWLISITILLNIVPSAPLHAATEDCIVSAVTKADTYYSTYVDVTSLYAHGYLDNKINILFGVQQGMATKKVSEAKPVGDKYYLRFDTSIQQSKDVGGNIKGDEPLFVFMGDKSNYGDMSSNIMCTYSADKDNPDSNNDSVSKKVESTDKAIENGTPVPDLENETPIDNQSGAVCTVSAEVKDANYIVKLTLPSEEIGKYATYEDLADSYYLNFTDSFDSNPSGEQLSGPIIRLAGSGPLPAPQGNTYTFSVSPDKIVTVLTDFHRPLDLGRLRLIATTANGEKCGGDRDKVAGNWEEAQIIQDCKDALRKQECIDAGHDADPTHKYDNDVCLSYHSRNTVKESDGTPTYDTLDCKTKRGMNECKSRPQNQGWVYVRVFAVDPANSCVTFLGFTKSLINYAMLIATLVAAYMFMMGGFKYTMSRGNPAGLIEARDQIMHATIGLVLLAVSYIVILILQGSFGFLHLDLVGPFGAVFGN